MNMPHTPLRTVSAIALIDLARTMLKTGALDDTTFTQAFPKLSSFVVGDAAATQALAANASKVYEMRLPEEILIRLWQRADAHLSRPDVGVSMGQTINENAKGVLANWLAQCDTLGEACQTFRDNVAFMNPSECWEFKQKGDLLHFHFSFQEPGYPSIATDRSMAIFLTWAAYLSQREIVPINAYFAHPAPPDSTLYTAVFGANLHFGHDFNGFDIPAAVANYRIPTANAYLKALLQKKAVDLRARFPDKLSQTVYSLITDNPRQFPCIEVACDALHMSRSTLYRQLKKEGTSYTEILNRVRAEQAKALKAEGMKDSYIAEKIGFQDTASYYKARKRWGEMSAEVSS